LFLPKRAGEGEYPAEAAETGTQGSGLLHRISRRRFTVFIAALITTFALPDFLSAKGKSKPKPAAPSAPKSGTGKASKSAGQEKGKPKAPNEEYPEDLLERLNPSKTPSGADKYSELAKHQKPDLWPCEESKDIKGSKEEAPDKLTSSVVLFTLWKVKSEIGTLVEVKKDTDRKIARMKHEAGIYQKSGKTKKYEATKRIYESAEKVNATLAVWEPLEKDVAELVKSVESVVQLEKRTGESVNRCAARTPLLSTTLGASGETRLSSPLLPPTEDPDAEWDPYKGLPPEYQPEPVKCGSTTADEDGNFTMPVFHYAQIFGEQIQDHMDAAVQRAIAYSRIQYKASGILDQHDQKRITLRNRLNGILTKEGKPNEQVLEAWQKILEKFKPLSEKIKTAADTMVSTARAERRCCIVDEDGKFENC